MQWRGDVLWNTVAGSVYLGLSDGKLLDFLQVNELVWKQDFILLGPCEIIFLCRWMIPVLLQVVGVVATAAAPER